MRRFRVQASKRRRAVPVVLWILLMAAVVLLGAAALLYLVRNVRRFTPLKKSSRRKAARRLARCERGGAAAAGRVCAPLGRDERAHHPAASGAVRSARRSGLPGDRQLNCALARNYASLAALLLTVAYLGVGWYQASHVWRRPTPSRPGRPSGSSVGLIADSHLGTTFDGAGFAAHMKTPAGRKAGRRGRDRRFCRRTLELRGYGRGPARRSAGWRRPTACISSSATMIRAIIPAVTPGRRPMGSERQASAAA